MREVSKKKREKFSLQVKCSPGIVAHPLLSFMIFTGDSTIFKNLLQKRYKSGRLFQVIGSVLLLYDIMTLVK
ncbi:hypothetical protein M769_0119340 [Bacillus haynesii]|nr:hypothetical protein M769_0119340 [Bacillus haynesii]